jgi:glucosyl-3-phosphoglycerate synthase
VVIRRFHHSDFDLSRLLAHKAEPITVVLPAREVADTIGEIVGAIVPLREAGLVDELLVVDAASADGTAEVARAAGACVEDENDLLPEYGPCLGKGDAMWRGLAATRGEIVAYLDTDTRDFIPRFVLGLLGPMLAEPGVDFVKGAFRRPFDDGRARVPDGGGRVTELLARPFLNLHVPSLAAFRQPLAGEIGARREVLEAIAFPVGYGIEIAMMIDVERGIGLERMAQSDLGTRQNRHQPLSDLTAMALGVLAAAERRVHGEEALSAAAPGPLLVPDGAGFRARTVITDERPPLSAVRAAA